MRVEYAICRLSRNGRLVGLGFAVDRQHVVTCAHVLNKAHQVDESLPPRTLDQADFPDTGVILEVDFAIGRYPGGTSGDGAGGGMLTASPAPGGWLPSNPARFAVDDIAVLRLSGPVPSFVPDVVAGRSRGRDAVQVFGPVPGRLDGGHLVGEALGEAGGGRIQVNVNGAGFRVGPGFSGGPVWHRDSGEVVGVLVARGRGDAAVDAYMLDAGRIAEVWQAWSAADAGGLHRGREVRDPVSYPHPVRFDAAQGVQVGEGNIQHIHLHAVPPPAEVQPAEATEEVSARLLAYLDRLVDGYRWLELQGIREAGSLRIELEKVYVALKAEPESEYDLRHLANLHSIEVSEAAGGASLDSIEPTRLEALDAENVRRTHRPRKDESRRASVTEVKTIADAFRLHRRMVLLGGPGSGKTTLGHWLALQLARGVLRQLPCEVASESAPIAAEVARVHVCANATTSFSKSHFTRLGPADKASAITIGVLPARGTLKLSGTPVAVGQVVKADQIERLTFTPAENECARRYAHLEFWAGDEPVAAAAGALVIDVGMHIRVPVSQVDPDRRGSEETEQFVDMGPARVPIFLRLAHFARELAERERGGRPTISLEEYLGQDPDSCSRHDRCTAASRNALLRRLIEGQRAVVILDGLDELPEANRRTVSLKIQDFIERFTKPNPTDESEAPWLTGGNQVIVTSRYVGYKLMPIRGGCVHFGIQAMQRPAVEHFARAWTAAVNAELAGDIHGRLSADELIAEIYDDSRPAIRELATNPLLVTILATVYWADGSLPDQRAGVYHSVVENLLRIWLNRPECQAHALTREELLAALEPLAADMQENRGSNGLIGLDRIGELIEGPLALMRKSNPADRSFRPVLDALLTTIRRHVGLLAEQSSGNYAFFHRTFQEFLAARHMLSDREHTAEMIVERLDDPQWREPLLLALGLAMISPEWGGPRTRAQLLADVLAGDNRDSLIPRAALLIVNALPDLQNVPRPIVGQVVRQLLRCYAFSQDQPQAEGLREGICDVFARLRNGPQSALVSEAIAQMIQQPAADRDYSGAAAGVLLRINWFTTEAVEALLQVAHRDQTRLGWPIHWALLAALGQPAGDRSWSKPAPALNMPRLLATYLPMRRLLESSPKLTAFVRGDPGWLWLVIALYGGLGHAAVAERLRAHQQDLLRERQPAEDATEKTAGPPPSIPPIEFCPGDIVHDLADADLSRAIQGQLRLRRPSSELAGTFRRLWEQGADPAGSAEAIVGLAALGEDVVPLVRAALTEPDRQPAAHAALARFRWLRSLLQEPLLRSTETAARTLPEEAPEEHQLDLLRIVIEARTASGGGPLQVSDMIPAYRFVRAASAPVRDSLDAEYWAYVFSGLSGEGPDSSGVALGTIAAADLCAFQRLPRGWSRLSQARNHLARLRLPWPQMLLAPRCDTPVEHYLAMLDGLLESPPEYDYLAGHLLGLCRPFLNEHPSLIWETLAVCFSRGPEFIKGYLTGSTGDRVAATACSTAASGFATAWADHCGDHAHAEELGRALGNILLQRSHSVPDDEALDAEPSGPILVQASLITDAYLRFRALWRLSETIGREQAIPLSWNILALVGEITNRHDRARALEWIIMTIPDQQIGLDISEIFDLGGIVRALSRIADPENRARAQCRLAFVAPERLEDLLAAAIESVGQIADPLRTAEMISDIRSALGEVPSLAQALDALAGALPDAWLRDKARGRTSRLIATYRLQYGIGALAWRLSPDAAPAGARCYRLPYPTGQLAWGLLYLNATTAEMGEIEAIPVGGKAHWDLLLGPEWRAGVDGLIESAAEGGLRITAREASVLNRVVQSGRATILDALWGYLEVADAGVAAGVARWSAGNVAAERWKALVQVEAGRLTSENCAHVVELAAAATDRLRLRAELALHGHTPYCDNSNRRWSVARVGAEAMETFASLASRADYPPSVRTSLIWAAHDIHVDDAKALSRWLSQAAAKDDAPATWILENMESIDDGLVPQLLEAVSAPAASPRLQRALLFALARLAHCGKALNPWQSEVQRAVAAVPSAVRRGLRVIPGGPATYLKIAAEVSAGFSEDERLESARWKIEESMLWLGDRRVLDEDACQAGLKQIGGELYIYIPRYWSNADDAAAPLSENEDALRLLLSWVEAVTLSEGSDDVRHLLTATEALARVSPDAFTALADPDIWESILTQWAETGEHWTTRLAAVRLLGLLRRVTERIVVALRAAMGDVSFVQQAAYNSVVTFRHMKGDIIPELVSLLDDPSSGIAASTTRLLVSLSRAEGALVDRRRILRGLQDAVAGSPKVESVYLMEERIMGKEGWVSIQFVDRLDRILYRAILQVSGL